MTADFFQSIGGLLLKYNSYARLVEDLYLTAIVDSFKRLQKIPNISTLKENDIRYHLVFDLENNNQILRPFIQSKTLKLTKENTILLSPSDRKRTDIEFFISLRGEFIIECKNLKSVEQRYVDDGIKRFTDEYYAKEDSEAGMIGFVVAGDFSKIIDGLKTIVAKRKLSPSSEELLRELCIKYKYSFHSKHDRKTKQPILLHHVFVCLK